LFYRYADLKGKDFVSAWLHHLIMSQIGGQNTYLLSTDEDLLFESTICQPAVLPQLINIYRQGQQQPNAFFVEAALAYIRQAHKHKTGNSASKSPMDAAKDCLLQAVSRAYEPELRQLYGNVADMSLVLLDSFSQTCETLLLPAWEAAHGY
jgi:exodeoxyribonuclease V gamma subunit